MSTDPPWCRIVLVRPDETVAGTWTLDGPGRPGLDTVDELARHVLRAGRGGMRLVVEEMSPDLRDLLELAGLSVEVGGQAEGGEQTLRVERGQEEGHLGDPAV